MISHSPPTLVCVFVTALVFRAADTELMRCSLIPKHNVPHWNTVSLAKQICIAPFQYYYSQHLINRTFHSSFMSIQTQTFAKARKYETYTFSGFISTGPKMDAKLIFVILFSSWYSVTLKEETPLQGMKFIFLIRKETLYATTKGRPRFLLHFGDAFQFVSVPRFVAKSKC